MKSKIFYCLLFALLLIGCTNHDEKLIISDVIGIDVSDGEVVSFQDSHSGFHGDGIKFIEMSFSNEEFMNSIRYNPQWNKLPLTDNLKVLVYGNEQIHPWISDKDKKCLFPKIKDGYYYFLDRQENTQDDLNVLNRSSVNFTMIIYDKETRMLYFCEVDS